MKEEYEKLRKKHSKLPDFDRLNSFFDIFEIEPNEFYLRNMKKKVAEKILGYCDVLEGVLQPEAGIAAMHESKYVTEKERQAAIGIYMAFMKINRLALEMSVEEDDSANAEFIRKAFDAYSENRDKLKGVMSFLKDTWQRNDTAKAEIEYLR